MRGLRGRRGVAAVIAVVLGLLALGASTAVVVAVAGHRPPPAVAVGTRPLPPAPPTTAGPTPAASPPATVRIDETADAVTIRVGTLLDVELHGDPGNRWSEPDTQTPALLQRLSGSADPTSGNAQATFRALAAGDAVVLIERSTSCATGPNGGVCGVEARRIAVTVTA